MVCTLYVKFCLPSRVCVHWKGSSCMNCLAHRIYVGLILLSDVLTCGPSQSMVEWPADIDCGPSRYRLAWPTSQNIWRWLSSRHKFGGPNSSFMMNLFNAHIHYLVSREYPTMIYRLTCVHNILIFNFKMNEFYTIHPSAGWGVWESWPILHEGRCEIWSILHESASSSGVWTKFHTCQSEVWEQKQWVRLKSHEDEPKYHEAKPSGIWAYPSEWQRVQFCPNITRNSEM